MSTTRVLCKFSRHGSCLKGDKSDFSHHGSDQAANNVCTFYQRGACSSDTRFTHDHAGVSHNNNPVFQHGGGAGDVVFHHGLRSAADPHQALLH